MGGDLFIGTSGWNYKSWGAGLFYPSNVKSAEWLRFYTQSFGSVEVNNTFYRLPEKHVFESWREQTPRDFVFTIKASRFITHMKKLLEPEEHVATFLRRASGLERKLHVLLFQLPPFWKFNPDRLDALCRFVRNQKIMPGVRAALEIRHPSWNVDTCFAILRAHNVALAFADWPALKVTRPITADFIFVRRHGPAGLYSSEYSPEQLHADAKLIHGWLAEGQDVYAYFNNDVHGYAVKNAAFLQGVLSGKTIPHPIAAR